ncbi:MAG: hypothetical protein ACJ760_06830 [Thermoleophilaceae bacterium]
MNTHRVTLTAFGTTGVLLAASLTMLALVSALVTFNAWPTRDRGATPAEIAVESPHAARVVRAVRRSSTTAGGLASSAGGAGSADGGPAARLPGVNPGGDGGGGPGTPGGNTGGSGDPSPPPRVGTNPPGEDPNPGGGPRVGGDTGGIVDQVTSTAYQAVPQVDLPPAPDVPALP